MSQLKAKQIAGPLVGRTGSALIFDGSKAGWSTDLNSALALPSGPTNARPQDSSVGHLRHNSTTGKIEAYENGAWTNVISDTATMLQRFQIRAKLSATNALPTVASEYTLPPGWTVSNPLAAGFTFTHNTGRVLQTASILSQVGGTGNVYRAYPFTNTMYYTTDVTGSNVTVAGFQGGGNYANAANGFVIFNLFF